LIKIKKIFNAIGEEKKIFNVKKMGRGRGGNEGDIVDRMSQTIEFG
jgi:hypothetical protein